MLGVEKLTAEFARLNKNLEQHGPTLARVASAIEKANENAQALKVAAAQLSMLNQILMQVRKAEGGAAMAKLFVEGALKTAARWATRSG